MHYYSIHLDIIISSQICLFYCFMPTWVIFWVIFVAMAAILKMPPLCRKSRLARKKLFLYFSHHILPPYQKETKLVRCHFLGILQIGTLSQKVGLKSEKVRKWPKKCQKWLFFGPGGPNFDPFFTIFCKSLLNMTLRPTF